MAQLSSGATGVTLPPKEWKRRMEGREEMPGELCRVSDSQRLLQALDGKVDDLWRHCQEAGQAESCSQ